MPSKLHYFIIVCTINIFPVIVCCDNASEILKKVYFQDSSTTFKKFPTNGTNLPLNLKIWNDNRIKRQAYQALSDHGATYTLHTMQKFKNFAPMHFLTIPNVVDVVIFSHVVVGDTKELLAVAIEMRNEGNILTVFQLGIKKDWKWHRLEDNIITIGTSITFHEIEEGTVFVIHEKNYKGIADCLAVYLLDDNRRLKRMQNILIEYEVSTVILKMLSSDLFLVISYSDVTNSKKFIALYKWRGFHFDQIQVLETSSVVFSLTASDNALILAVAVYNDVYGLTHTSSLIFGYTEETGKFTPYQNIPTIGATWVGLFSFNFAKKQELFLLFVNNIISRENNITETMIYKMSKSIFLPFQSIKTKPIFSWHAFQARNSECLLISKIAKSPLIYQYNGWKFELVSSSTDLPNVIHEFQFTKNIQLGSNSMLLSMEKNNNTKAVVYKAVFNEEQKENYRNRLEELCTKVTNEIKPIDSTQDNMFKEHNNYNEARTDYSAFENSIIENAETQKIILGGEHYIRDIEVKGVNDIINVIKSQHNIVKKLSQAFLRYVTVDYFQSLKNFTGSYIRMMNKNNFIKRLNINTLNGIPFNSFKTGNFLKKSWQPHVNGFIDNLETSKIQFQEINNVKQNHFHELVNEYIRLNGVVLNGDIFLKKGLHVGKKINNVFFDVETIILKSEDQHLRGRLIANDLVVNKLGAHFINLMSLEELLNMIERKNVTSDETFSFHTLRIKTLSVYALFGRSEFTNINQHLLYKFGNQQINNTLQANIMKCHVFKGPFMKLEFYLVRNSNIIVSQKIHLSRVTMKSLKVKNYINNIEVKNDNLNVVLLESVKSQNFEDSKVFNNIEIMGKVRLSNEIKRSLISEINSQRITKHPLRISGDFEINGNITVSDGFIVKDIFNEKVFAKALLVAGIKLTELIIEIPVIIKSKMGINNIHFDLINAVSSKELVNVVAADNVSFEKKGFENVNILGQCDGIQFLNGVNLEKFRSNAFYKNVDQIITGMITFAEIHVKCIETNTSRIDGSDLNMLIKYEENLDGISVVIHKDLSVQTALQAINMNVRKQVAGFNMNEIIFDTLYSGLKHYIINSNKVFYQPLYMFTLIPRKQLLDVKAKEMLSTFNGNKEIRVQHSTHIYNTISAYNIVFTELLDGIHAYEFGKSWLLYEGTQEFTNKQIVSVVNIMDGIKVTSNKINEYDVEYFKSIIKVNDNVKLQTLKSEEIISNHIIVPNNMINEIDLNQILLKKSFGPQTVTGLYNFQYSLMITENFLFSKFFGSSMQYIQDFLRLQDNCKNKLYLRGRASFHWEPRISVIGNTDISELRNNVWFLADNVNFKYKVSLRNVTFLQGLSCASFFNSVNLSETAKTYMSKSQEQRIPSRLYIKSTSIVCVESKKANIQKALLTYLESSLKMFAENIWHTHQDMLISNYIQMNVLECNDCNLIGTINEIDLNLEGLLKNNEVNKLNMTELKTFGNMLIENVVMKPTSRFNEIDMNDWFNNALYKSTKLQQVIGLKQIAFLRTPNFRTITMESLTIPDDILLTNTNITLSGNKSFRSQLEDVTYFQNVTLFDQILSIPQDSTSN